jgi:diacylglycerol kinase
MPEPFQRPPFTWRRKFGYAFRGLSRAIGAGQSFFVHGAAAVAVVALAAWLRCERWEWCVLAIAVGGVFTAELFNSAIERLAQAVTSETRPEIRDALDIAAAAVLVASLTSMALGAIVFVLH